MPKIDINKTYRTRNGLEVRIDEVGGKGLAYPVIGRIKTSVGWLEGSWTLDGRWVADEENHSLDLIEVTEEATTDFDPTQNEKPLGLLTKEEQEILRNWPHGVEFYTVYGGWEEVSDPSYLPSTTYRAKLAPERIVTWHKVYISGKIGPGYATRKAVDMRGANRLCVYRITRNEDGSDPQIEVEPS